MPKVKLNKVKIIMNFIKKKIIKIKICFIIIYLIKKIFFEKKFSNFFKILKF